VEPAPAREVSSLVFGIGMQEMVIVGLLFLVIFGPSKLPDMARDLGRFVNEARRSVEEFKEDLVSEEEGSQDPRKGRDPAANREPEENVQREEVAAIDRSAPRTEQL
jgi:sec-independent protein translocase protein TatB